VHRSPPQGDLGGNAVSLLEPGGGAAGLFNKEKILTGKSKREENLYL